MKRKWCRWTRCWWKKRVLSHIWVKPESDLDQISTRLLTSFNQSWYARNTYEKSTNTQLIHKKQTSFSLVSHLKQETFSCILQIIQKEYLSRIKCWNSFFFRTSVVLQADQFNWSFIQLNIIELRVQSFDHAAHVKDIEVFSIILKKIDVFLNLESISFSSLDSNESKSRHTTLTVHSKNSSTLAQFSSHSQNSIYDKNHCLNLHQMKKKFYLTAFMTQEDSEVYW